ncbi:MAG: hypothetical protein WBM08_03590, partial [Prochlorococcaceae cyanobacterium]
LKLEARHHFNRERFLLRCVAWIIGVQFILYLLGVISCIRITETRLSLLRESDGPLPTREIKTVCLSLPDKLQEASTQGMAVLLALLGGGALALEEARRSAARKPEDPRRPDGDR